MQRERDNAVLQATLQAELASARLQTLRLQLNPHFLFNALNSIASLVPSDAAKADTAIAALSSFLRASLSATRGEETTLENELRLVDAYLEIEVLRFEWLTVDLDVPDALRSACVSGVRAAAARGERDPSRVGAAPSAGSRAHRRSAGIEIG
jgi:LytS/YehU family sensor histidine kinase